MSIPTIIRHAHSRKLQPRLQFPVPNSRYSYKMPPDGYFPLSNSSDPVDLLILGAGWTYQFLRPLLESHSPSLTYAATTRSGSTNPPTLPFTFDPDSSDLTPYGVLPNARCILITFPITVPGATSHLLHLYSATHHRTLHPELIQLGSTGAWGISKGVIDRHNKIDEGNARAEEEDRILEERGAVVLNLAGLWGAERSPRNWLPRVAGDREKLKGKGSLHLVHGEDVARAVVGVAEKLLGRGGDATGRGERWLVSDLRVYDWWDLAAAWGKEEWVQGLMKEEEVRWLPRNADKLGRVLDAREFWEFFGLWPKWSLTWGEQRE